MMEYLPQSTAVQPRGLIEKEIKALAGVVLDAPNHYAVLGIRLDATTEEINKSYCHAVTTFHPLNQRTVIGTDTVLHWLLSSTFSRLSEAYRVLSNTQHRIIYDRSLKAVPANQAVGESVALPTAMLTPTAEMQTVTEPTETTEAVEVICPMQSMSLATPEWMMSKLGRESRNGTSERRRVMRVPMRIPIVVSFKNNWRDKGETLDLSPLGAKFTLDRPLEPGMVVHMNMPMPKRFRTKDFKEDSYHVEGTVLRVNQTGSGQVVGVEFR